MTTPLGAGSIGLGLGASGGSAAGMVRRLRLDARAAVEWGFDGVTLSEHHGGFPGYFPNPVLMCGLILADMPRGWAAAAPSILPLRHPHAVAEDLAWIAAAHPGRVAAGFVPGYQERDFDALGADFDRRSAQFWSGLDDLTTALRGPGAPDGDAAIAATREQGFTVLAGVAGPKGARLAARADVGLLLMSLASASDTATLVREYRDAGGERPCVLIRRVQVGGHDGAHPLHARWLAESAGAPTWLRNPGADVIGGDSEAVADALVHDLTVSGATALNIRIGSPDPADVLHQIELVGAEVLPRVRSAMGWPAPDHTTAPSRGVDR